MKHAGYHSKVYQTWADASLFFFFFHQELVNLWRGSRNLSLKEI